MKLGFKRIVGKMTQGDEYGLYRENDERKCYLMVSFSTWKEMDRYGRKMATLFDRKFSNLADKPHHEEDENAEPENKAVTLNPSKAPNVIKTLDPDTRLKPRRVTGVAKAVKPMIAEGKTDEEIFTAMLPKYLDAGRTEAEARELLLSYVKDIRAGKV
jgi:hypothetical protein